MQGWGASEGDRCKWGCEREGFVSGKGHRLGIGSHSHLQDRRRRLLPRPSLRWIESKERRQEASTERMEIVTR